MKLGGKIGLLGGVGIVVGGVIGMGVYTMIPSIAAKAGTSTWLALIIALVVSLISVVPIIQLSSALPVAGGGYLWTSRILHPMIGTLVSNWAIFGGSASVCVVSTGLALQLLPLLTFPMSVHMFSLCLVGVFLFFYMFGLKLQTSVQVLMSLQMLIALFIYIIWAFSSDTVVIELSYAPVGNFGIAVLLAFNVCFGFQIVTELGEEIKDPHKNIPLALFIGAALILVIYLGLTVVYIAMTGPSVEQLTEYLAVHNTSPLIDSAEVLLPKWAMHLLWFGAISAGLTSYNAGAIAIPRELFSQARDKMLPESLSKVNPRSGTPIRAVLVFFAVVALILTIGQIADSTGIIESSFSNNPIDFYGFMTVCGIMLLTVFSSTAAWKLPNAYPEQYHNAYFKLPVPLLRVFVIVSIITSVGFVGFLFYESPIIALIYAVITSLIVIYYTLRKKALAKLGITPGTVHDILGE